MGAVPGVIGVLQAVETVKILSGAGDVLSGRLMLYDALAGAVRTVRLRPRNPEAAKIEDLIDYVQFCGAGAHDKGEPLKLLAENDRIDVTELKVMLGRKEKDFVLVYVRTRPEMDICRLPGSANVPMSDVDKSKGVDVIKSMLAEGKKSELVMVCRRGNDSQKAVVKLREALTDIVIRDVKGGLHAWAKKIDKDFPVY